MNNKCVRQEQLGWSKSVVMICSKCGQEAEAMKADLKSYCKERLGSDVRVINSGCLNICPEERIAIVVASSQDPAVFQAYSVAKDAQAEDIFNDIFKEISE